MKSTLLRRKYVGYALVLFTFIPLIGFSQVQTARQGVVVNGNCHGFYEYLPQGYETGSQTYPLMIFVHGTGEVGDGDSQLSLVLRNGPPKLINNGTFPTSFTVGGKTYKFIVISPQFIVWPSSQDVDALITYAINHYRVDQKRIYLTGLSMGGGVTWQYAGENSNYTKRIAAILPVSGASYPDLERARVMAEANLPVWATHNLNDPTVPDTFTTVYVRKINMPPAPIPPAKATIFNVTGHDAWTQTYDPAFKEDNLNVYEWMLQFDNTRSLASPLPIVLTDYKAFLSGNKEVTISWATSTEINNRYFTVERSADGSNFSVIGQVPATNKSTGDNYSYTDNNPNYGNNFYRLSQTDFDGKTVKFEIKNVTVSNGDGSNKLIIFPNPADSYVTLQLSDKETGQLEIRIIDAAGKVQNTFHYDKTNSYWQQQLPVNGLPAGYYIIDVRGSRLKRTQGFIKK